MKQYHDLLKHVLEHGTQKGDRTGTGTKSVFGYQMRFDLAKGFPMVTTKKLHLKSIVYELLWFLKGDTNIAYLQENGVRIWNEWADANGDLGPVYGHQWRNWNDEGIDQIEGLVETLKKNPNSRRMLVTAWNPSVLPEQFKVFFGKRGPGQGRLTALPCLFSILCGRGKIILSIVPKECGYLFGRALQHRLLCPIYDDGGPSLRLRARRIHPYFRGRACL